MSQKHSSILLDDHSTELESVFSENRSNSLYNSEIRSENGYRKGYGDRFIPTRINLDELGRMPLLENNKENMDSTNVAKRASDVFPVSSKGKRLLKFTKDKEPEHNPGNEFIQDLSANGLLSLNKVEKKQSKLPKKPEKVLDAPGLINDYYLNLIDWGRNNLLAVCLGEGAFVWNPATQEGSQFFVSENSLMVPTSIGWSCFVSPFLT
jgi:cell division cycle protein 20 (cofactor of APC complex)